MSDDKIIDFGSFQNKVKDSDIDKLEEYMYSMYSKFSRGSISPLDFSKSINEFMKKNNISIEKFGQMQEKLLERYGYDPKEIEKDIRNMGLDYNQDEPQKNTDSVRKFGEKVAFFERFEGLEEKKIMYYLLDNGINNVKFIIEDDVLTLISEKKIDLSDSDINTFIAAYRQVNKEKIRVVICEATNTYDYF
nr:DUF3867 family protein [uncultured Peptostreptococcus sp.]